MRPVLIAAVLAAGACALPPTVGPLPRVAAAPAPPPAAPSPAPAASPPSPATTPAGAVARAAVEIRGAARLEYDETSGQVVAEGAPVVVVRGRTELRAPRVRYDLRSRVVTASGGVDVAEPELALRSDEAEYRVADEQVRASGRVTLRVQRPDGISTLTAPQVEGSFQMRRFVAVGGVELTRGEWQATGQRLDYDDRARVAVLTGGPEVRYRDATMTAAVVTVHVAEELARGEGGVVVRRRDLVGRAPRAEVSGRSNLATLSGGARVDRGADRVTAEVIEVDLETNRVAARGGSRLTLQPTPTATARPGPTPGR